MNTKYIILAIISLMLFSCYNEDDIVVEKGENKYNLQDSDDPVEKYRYNFYNDFGSVILYDYALSDYTWNITHTYFATFELEKVKDENKAAGLDYAKKVFLEAYPENFKKKFFPFKILLAESLQAYDWMVDGMVDYHAKGGKGFLCIGRVNDNVGTLTKEDLYTARAGVNTEFWMTYMFGFNRFKIPDSYYAVSEAYYDQELTEGVIEDYGFVWADTSWGTYFPGPYLDLKTFIEYIFAHTNKEMQDLCNKYPKIKQKYDILVYAMKDQFGYDLTSLTDL